MNNTEHCDNLQIIKLNRWFNLQRPRAFIVAICPIILFVWSLFDGDISHVSVYGVVTVIVLTVILAYFAVFIYPDRISFTPSRIEYNERIFRRFGVFTSRHSHKAECTLYNLHWVGFHQNSLEKCFNVGHIIVTADLSCVYKHDFTDEKSKTVTIYGVTDFENVSRRYKDFFKLENNPNHL